MSIASVFKNNRTQAVRLPADMRLPDEVQRVHVRAVGRERVIAPLDGAWDSFFLNSARVSEDFLSELESQQQSERESL